MAANNNPLTPRHHTQNNQFIKFNNIDDLIDYLNNLATDDDGSADNNAASHNPPGDNKPPDNGCTNDRCANRNCGCDNCPWDCDPNCHNCTHHNNITDPF